MLLWPAVHSLCARTCSTPSVKPSHWRISCAILRSSLSSLDMLLVEWTITRIDGAVLAVLSVAQSSESVPPFLAGLELPFLPPAPPARLRGLEARGRCLASALTLGDGSPLWVNVQARSLD